MLIMYTIFILCALFYFNLAHFKPRFLPFALTLLLPAYQIRLQVGALPTTLLEIGILASIAGLLLYQRTLLFTNEANDDQQSAKKTFSILALVLLAIATLQLFFSPDIRTALGLWRAYILEPVALFIVFQRLILTPGDRRRILGALLMFTGLLAAVELWQYAGFLPSPEPWFSEMPRRVTGFFAFPNAVGLFLSPIIALFLGLLLYPAAAEIFDRKQRRVLWAGVAAGIIAILLANVRGALLGIGAAYLLSLFFVKNKRIHLGVIASVIALLLIIPSTRHTAYRIATLRDTSSDVRVALWQGSLNLLTARPLTGSGIGGFPVFYPEYKLDKHVEILQYPHNIFLNFWSELGILGLLWVVAFFIKLFSLFFSKKSPATTSPPFLLPLLLSFFALLVYGLVDVPYFKNDLAVLWWLLLAMI